MTTTADLVDQVLLVATRLDPDVMTGEQALAAVEDLAVVDKAAVGALLFAALRVAKTNAWRGRGHKSPEDWLSATAGISVAEARRQLGTARKADHLGKTKDAMKKGKVSPEQADAITDAATADPAAEDDLLDLAERETHKNLREEAARRKAAAATDDEARERRVRRERSKRTWVDRDGAFHLHLRGPAADGARIEALVRPYEEQVFLAGRSDGVRDTFENRAYDAFLAAIGLGSAAPASAEPTGTAGPTPTPGPVKLPGGQNTKVIVRVDHTALLRGRTVAGETCEVAGFGPISVETARDLMADAFLAAVITKGRDVINVAHLGRGPNAYQRTALEAAAGNACTNITCNRTVNIDVDHRVPYAGDPVTRLDNLDYLCSGRGSCHDLKTHHGHQLEVGTGRRRLLPPDHPDHPGHRAIRSAGEAASADAAQRGSSPPTQVEQPTLC